MIINGDNISANVNNKIDISNPTNLADGTAASPSLTFTNDNDTGLFRSDNNTIGITVSGVKIADIDINGITAKTPYWNIVESQASGTNGHAGATFSSGSWVTRFLNTTIGTNTITGSSLSSNQFTLPSGTYRILASAPAYYVDSHKIKLYNITDSADTLIGTSECSSANNTGGLTTRSFVSGIFTITSSKIFQIQHRCATSRGTNGFGIFNNFGVVEIYTQVELWKIGN